MYKLCIYFANPFYDNLLQGFKQKGFALKPDYSMGDSKDQTGPMDYKAAQKLRDSFPEEQRKYISVYREPFAPTTN